MYYLSRLFVFGLFLLLLLKNTQAQNKLLLCTEYDQNGQYKGNFETWNIEKGGNYMYLLYLSKNLLNDTVFIRIEKTFNRKDSEYLYYDHYYLAPDISKKWAVNKYTFTKTGDYKISAYDRSNNLLSSLYTSIQLAENAYNDTYFKDTWYYNTSEIVFYEKATGDSMIGKNTVFTYHPEGSKVVLYIGQQNKQPLRTNHFVVKTFTDDKCHELISSDSYYVNENWHWTFVTVNFKQKGKYVVELYNDDDVYINRGKLEIK